MNTNEKLMMTVVLTALIVVMGMGLTVSFCVDHLGNGDSDSGSNFNDDELSYLISRLDWKGGEIYTDDGRIITVTLDATVVMERGLIKITNGTIYHYVVPSRIVSVRA